MSEPSKYNRIKFSRAGVQRDFILKAEAVLELTEMQLSQKLKVSRRTLRDWTKERITISHLALEKVAKLAGIHVPKHSIIDWHTHWQNAGRIGAKVKMDRYGNVGGDEKYRKEKWKERWQKTGQYQQNALHFQSVIEIKIPQKNELLAEFIGIFNVPKLISVILNPLIIYGRTRI